MGNKKSYKKIAQIVCVVIIILGIVVASYYFYQSYKANQIVKQLKSDKSTKYISTETVKEIQSQTGDKSSNPLTLISRDITTKMDHLQYETGNMGVWNLNKDIPSYNTIKDEYDNAHNTNKDVIGWIWVQNTNINYPIEHTDSDTYYLHHNWRNQDWWNGAIFLDKSIPNLSENTLLIHGHDMLNSLMFAELMEFRNPQFFNQHNKIVVFNGDKNEEDIFNPIGAFYAQPTQKFEFNIPKSEQLKYYKYMESKSIYPIEPVNDNKFLFLNSCLSNGTQTHLIVMSQRIKTIK